MSDEQYFIDQELGKAVLASLDPQWNEADLVVDVIGDQVRVELLRRDQSGLATPSDEVYAAVGKLVQHHKDEATGLRRAVYNFKRASSGKWKYAADFVYAP
jgi:hypothetical protein